MNNACTRDLMVDELIHELIRKEMRAPSAPRPFLVPGAGRRAKGGITLCAPSVTVDSRLRLISA